MSLADELRGFAEARKTAAPDDDDSRRKYPLLWPLLTQGCFADGSERLRGEIVIESLGTVFRVLLRDPQTEQQTSTTCLALADVFKALEAHLADAQAGWYDFKSWKLEAAEKRQKRKAAKKGVAEPKSTGHTAGGG